LGYEAATWEGEGEGVTAAKEHSHLMDALWRRQRAAAHRATPEALAEEQVPPLLFLTGDVPWNPNDLSLDLTRTPNETL
jgi:hypothetical protein